MNESAQQGFILTRSSRDRAGRLDIEYWLATDQGPALVSVSSERAVFFIKAQESESVAQALHALGGDIEITELALSDFQGNPLAAVYANTLQCFYRALEYLQANRGEVLESDFRPHDR